MQERVEDRSGGRLSEGTWESLPPVSFSLKSIALSARVSRSSLAVPLRNSLLALSEQDYIVTDSHLVAAVLMSGQAGACGAPWC